MVKRPPPELHELADQIGNFIHYWGFKKVHGRLWTHLFLSAEPLDAGELIDRLDVSKALVSMSLKDLMAYDVVLEAGTSPGGTLLYRANADVTTVITNVLRKRERQLIQRSAAACETLRSLSKEECDEWRIDGRRLKLLADMVGTGRKTLDALISLSKVDLSIWKRFRA